MRYAEIASPKLRPTDTPEFKAWFEGSKVVDAHGDPLRVFHGTAFDFDTFKLGALGRGGESHRSARLGFFFTTNPDLASEFAQTWAFGDREVAEGSHLIPCYLSIKSPMLMSPAVFLGLFEYGKSNSVQYRKNLIHRGYDGVRVTVDYSGNHEFHHEQWVAFDPRQIKSALSNRRFDPKKASITESA